jgi:hypothetical protein
MENRSSNRIFGFVIAGSDSDEAIHPSASCAMDCFASLAMTMLRENARQIDPTGKSILIYRKRGQAAESKIFRFSRRANQGHISCHPVPIRGAYHDRHDRGAGRGGRW